MTKSGNIGRIAMGMKQALAVLLAFACLLLALAPAQADTRAQKRIALTFDDVLRSAGPWLTPDERTARLIAGLKRANVAQAAFFVNPGNLAKPDGHDGEARIAAYVAAGHVIANHSFSHPNLSATTTDSYLANIDRASSWLLARQGFRPWFRFPFLYEGRGDKTKRDAVRTGLRDRGLANGYVTVDASDWNIEQNVIAAVRASKPVDRNALRKVYVESHVAAAQFTDTLAVQSIGRSPAHVMLLHETDIAALYITDLVTGLRKAGWTIVTADEAYADPIAKLAETVDVPSAQGTLTEALAWEKGLPAPRWYEGNTIKIANGWFATRVLKETQ